MTDTNTFNIVERACAALLLYRDLVIRAIIDGNGHRAATNGTLAGLTNEIATLRTALETDNARTTPR